MKPSTAQRLVRRHTRSDRAQQRRCTAPFRRRTSLRQAVEALEQRMLLAIDFGDAPDSAAAPGYPTLLMNNGARHVPVGPFLGLVRPDAEPDGQPTVWADGDDLNPPGGFDDEDGVAMPAVMVQGVPATIEFTVNTGGLGGAWVDGWLDLDGSGSWEEPAERIVGGLYADGKHNVTVVIPVGGALGLTYARFRVSSQGPLGAGGLAPDGEVEDYAVRVEAPPPEEIDFGDAPDFVGGPGYPTLLMNNGARHAIRGPWLGDMMDKPDAEPDGQPTVSADGDDLNPPLGLDDEDGVNIPAMVQGRPANVTFEVSGAAVNGAVVEGWIDFNANRVWGDDAAELVVSGLYPDGVHNVTFVVPASAAVGLTYARFRISTTGTGSPAGPASDGEVEDYQVCIEPPPEELDFGDAPDGAAAPGYPTLLMNNGARHVVKPGFFLGNFIDAEPDGQPTVWADGDDLNPPGGFDDEDGVVFHTALFSGVPNTITVTASVPVGVPGFLSGWIDLNGDGDWSDPGEKVIADVAVANGANSITFVPGAITATGFTYARFRLSSVQGLSYDGYAPDGEVEDYVLEIVPVKWLQRPDISPLGVDVHGGYVELADDFECTMSGPITDIHLWTSFYDDMLPPEGPASLWFTLTLYSDVPAGANNPYSHPGEVLWTRDFAAFTYDAGLCTQVAGGEWWFDPAMNWWQFPGDTQVYQYDFRIPVEEAYRQREGTIYWLGVQYGGGMDSVMGWKSSVEHWNDDATWLDRSGPVPTWRELRYGDGHPLAGGSMDLAFAITGVHEPPPEELDFGDAPDGAAAPGYPTLLMNNGARHVAVGPFLGLVRPDAEPDGQPTVWADGDDLNPPGGFDDEDGVAMPAVMVQGVFTTIEFTVNTAGLGGAWVDGWLDLDGSGSWEEPAERIVGGLYADGTHNVTVMIPVGGALGLTYARFRINSQSPQGVGGLAPDGEVEDYAVWVEEPPPSVKWEQPPEPTAPPDTYYGWNEQSVYGQWQIAADDWVCTTTDPVTDITWWGSFIGWLSADLPPDMPSAFHLAIWTDVPADPGDPMGFSHPGQVIWDMYCSAYDVEYFGWDYDPRMPAKDQPMGRWDGGFRFHQSLLPDEWFYQPGEDSILWLSIAAIYPPDMQVEHPFGWKTVLRDPASPAPDGAVRIWDPVVPTIGSVFIDGRPIWGPDGQWDLAFELTSDSQQPVWLQPANPQLPGIHDHDYLDTLGIRHTITVADQWLSSGAIVTDIHWWGNYETDMAGGEMRGAGIDHFRLSIHEDAGGMPGALLWWANVPFAVAGEGFTGMINNEGSRIYRYTYDLPAPFIETSNEIYWLDISAISNNPAAPAIWRWQEHQRSPQPIIYPAAQSLDDGPWQPIVWSGDPPRFTDMAFAIGSSGEEIIKWQQAPHPFELTEAYRGWDEYSVYGQHQIVADDWICLDDQPVTGIRWWGSFQGWSEVWAPWPSPTAFVITIWSDVPQGPGEPFSHPAQVLWQVLCRDFTYQPAGWEFDPRRPLAPPETVFLFEQRFSRKEWFWQEPGHNIYWISIAALYEDAGGEPVQYPWGWLTRPHMFNDDAVRIFDPTAPVPGSSFVAGEPIWWPTPEESWDMAFQLLTPSPLDIVIDGTDGADGWYVRMWGPSIEVYAGVPYAPRPPASPPAWSIPYWTVNTLTFNGYLGDDVLTVDFSNGSPIPVGGMTFDGGDDADRLAIVGTSAFDDLAVNSLGVAHNGSLIACTDVEATTLDTLTGQNSIYLNTLDVLNAFVEVAPGGKVLRTNGLTLGIAAVFDLNDCDLIIQATAATRDAVMSAVDGWIASARNFPGPGMWLGPGITSSAARANPLLTGLASIINDDGTGATVIDPFNGETVDVNCVLVKYTYNGDADLNGIIDADDYFRIDQGFLNNWARYRNGDFNYNPPIDADDYFLIDWAFLNQGPPLKGATMMPPGAPPRPAASPLAGLFGTKPISVLD